MGRPHIARVLIGKGLARDIEDAFDKFLKPCNVPKFHIPMAEAITEIQRIGGVAVLAHPSSISAELDNPENLNRGACDNGTGWT